MFTSKELNAFICTAEEKSITLAANRLCLTPPSVCSMVKKLEKRINRILFIRIDGEMILTSDGLALFNCSLLHYKGIKGSGEKTTDFAEKATLYLY
ncbi:helix-turn-helix domain-containing protein [Photorhabdus temperata]|uniref:HTH lysR-type domain-containing protein n=1 Tax=Photorhabdus temperata J3 TaxID=1389415 RepID=U7R460_PHOTE|nr:LysR family transcriptional regulator [Photorhabdus temperata]EQB99490.1 hypothetical protein B738_17437 [Photorhabdus temperata subsp. temperata M1021]ERT14555.1 hypothetical protein O185_03040 [Photorhabdus temperata J3]